MNIFTALLLSTKGQACFSITAPQGIIVCPRLRYQVQVMRLDESLYKYQFEVFRVTYPDEEVGKGRGAPSCAKKAHYCQRFPIDVDLRAFLDAHFDVEGWQPVEEEKEE